MPNSNCLDGMVCPNCGSEEPFSIEATAAFVVYDDGTDEHNSVTWDDYSSCECLKCGYQATVSEFTIAKQKTQKTGRTNKWQRA